MVGLGISLSFLEVPTDPAVVDQSAGFLFALAGPELLGLEHVVTLLAKAHASESCHLNRSESAMEVYNY